MARIAMRLIQAGCDTNMASSSQDDLNALMYAAYHNHVTIANVLLEHNCNIDSTDHVIIIFIDLNLAKKHSTLYYYINVYSKVGVHCIGQLIEITSKLLSY